MVGSLMQEMNVCGSYIPFDIVQHTFTMHSLGMDTLKESTAVA